MASAIVPSLLLIWYFHSRDEYPEPIGVLLKTFFLGVLTIPAVLIVALPVAGLLKDVADPVVSGFLQAFLTAAFPEEFFKYLVVWLYASRHKEFDEPMDGVVYGAVASLGFATLENILYVSTGGIGLAIMRALMAVPGHAFMGAIMGYYIGQAKFRPAEKTSLMLKGYFVPVLLHGLYDFPLLSAKGFAGQQVPGYMLLLLLLSFATLIFEWIWSVKIIRRLRGEQAAWAAAHPSANISGVSGQQPFPVQQGQGQPYPQAGYGQPGYPQPQPQSYGYPQPNYPNPYAVQPQWNPYAPPPTQSSGNIVGGLVALFLGLGLAGFGGICAFGGILLLAAAGQGGSEDPVTVGATALVMGIVMLIPGLLLFAFGIKLMNRKSSPPT